MTHVSDRLWEDFLSLGKKYQNEMNVPQFAGMLLTYTFKMMYDCAPNGRAVKEFTELSMKEAYEWHLKDKGDSNGRE